VCPLFSWYKENLFDGFTREKFDMPFDTQTMWPWDITGSGDTNDAQQPEIADFFQRLNSRRVSTAPATAVEALRQAEAEWKILQEGQTVSSRRANKKVHNKAPTVISMSHFVPRQECYPGPRRLCGVMGCREIETQIRNLGATCHVFGHSHIACDRMLDAIRYLQHPLGYPTDYHRKVKPIRAFGGDAISHAVDISKAPLATVGKLILQEIAKEIQESSENLLERPPGKWTRGETREELDVFDSSWEDVLEADMGLNAEKIAELWSAPPSPKELCISITHATSGDKLVLNVSNQLLVKQLKELIVAHVKRGPAKRILLSSSGENSMTLSDDILLSSVENEIEEGLLLTGIQIGEGQLVDVGIIHALSETRQILVVRVLDTSTILDVRKVIKDRLEERYLSSCKIVRSAGASYVALRDEEFLNGRTELRFLGRSLPDQRQLIIFLAISADLVVGMKQKRLEPVKLMCGSTVEQLKAAYLARDGEIGGKFTSIEQFDLFCVGTREEVPLNQRLWSTCTFTVRCVQQDASDVGNSLLLPTPMSETMPTQVVSTSREFCIDGHLKIEMDQFAESTVLDIKKEICRRIRRGPLERIVLSCPGSGELLDSMKLKCIEEEKQRTIEASGLDIGPPKKVKVRIVVADSKVPQELNIVVDDTSSIAEIKDVIMQELGLEKDQVRLGTKNSLGTWTTIPDAEFLNGRQELSMSGPNLPAHTLIRLCDLRQQCLIFKLESVDGTHKVSITIPSTCEAAHRTVRDLKARISEEVQRGPPEQIGLYLKDDPRGYPDALLADDMELDAGNTQWTLAQTESGGIEVQDSLVVEGINLGPPVDVDVEVLYGHFLNERLVVSVKDTARIIDVRRGIMEHLHEPDLSMVQLQGTGFRDDDKSSCIHDTELLNGRRSFMMVGQSPDQESRDLAVKVYVDRALDFHTKVLVRRGSFVRDVKEKLVEDDPSGSTSLESFSLRISAEATPLKDNEIVTSDELEICEPMI